MKCAVCGDVFPCYHPCEHLDCITELGFPLPDWVSAPWYTPTKTRPVTPQELMDAFNVIDD